MIDRALSPEIAKGYVWSNDFKIRAVSTPNYELRQD